MGKQAIPDTDIDSKKIFDSRTPGKSFFILSPRDRLIRHGKSFSGKSFFNPGGAELMIDLELFPSGRYKTCDPTPSPEALATNQPLRTNKSFIHRLPIDRSEPINK